MLGWGEGRASKFTCRFFFANEIVEGSLQSLLYDLHNIYNSLPSSGRTVVVIAHRLSTIQNAGMQS